MGREQDNERMVLDTKFGKLVCEVMVDSEDYKEFAIDLYRNDGKAVQVCVVGTYEYDKASDGDKVHVNLWDGENVDCCATHHVEPYGNGWWGEETL